ncbi:MULTISPECIES: hypothetical protein [Mesorhizobium]|uniref:Uncharacterized protein n=1 Tax=Mesorhizobium denitrificans TaxID=2294114 RepID=A0A371XBZ6_9HYPH|nr:MULTISPECIES: hypothetical protein [Mesorhizobium]RFC66740.1 hypothetical protein DY251_14455 [Mesorhizobium denitrificans]
MKHVLAEIRASSHDILPIARIQKLPHWKRTLDALERRGIIRRKVKQLNGDIYQLHWEEIVEGAGN